MVMVNDKINNDIEMYLCRGPFKRLFGYAGAMRCAGTCPELPQKPLDATIGGLLSLYCPGNCQGNSKQINNEKMEKICWPF